MGLGVGMGVAVSLQLATASQCKDRTARTASSEKKDGINHLFAGMWV